MALLHRRASILPDYVSFEWYPPSACLSSAQCLLEGPTLLSGRLRQLRLIPELSDSPLRLTEFGSGIQQRSMLKSLATGSADLQVALEFFVSGGQRAFVYGYEPGSYPSEVMASHTVFFGSTTSAA